MQCRKVLRKVFYKVVIGALLCWTALPLDLRSAQAEALDTFKPLLQEALVDGPSQVDLGALREAYAATPIYNGMSRLKEMFAQGLQTAAADPFAGFTAEEIKTAISLDFPLLDSHRIAFSYYKHMTPPDEKWMGQHANWYNALTDEILSTAVTEGTVTTYKVLSVGEEYEILDALGLERTTQALQNVGGVAYDVFKYDDRTIRFDISAFFGKF